MSSNGRILVGDVFERKPSANPVSPPTFGGSRKTGFPKVQHRNRSAFARAKEEQGKNGDDQVAKLRNVPTVLSTGDTRRTSNGAGRVWEKSRSGNLPLGRDENVISQQVGEENKIRVENMTDEEREEARREIIEHFGAGIGDLLKKIREAREARMPVEQGLNASKIETESEQQFVGFEGDLGDSNLPLPSRDESDDDLDKPSTLRRVKSEDVVHNRLSPILLPTSSSSTRPSSRSDRKLRFAEITADDVHVYESAPVSPRKIPLPLPPPPDVSDDSVISINKGKKKALRLSQPSPAQSLADHTGLSEMANGIMEPEPEEGTPEYIRRRFFPDVPAHDPNIAWMESEQSESNLDPSSSQQLRFDLTGTPIPESISNSLPTHLGLHHHANGQRAGYTLDDAFLLSRSTVPAQRATMLSVLSRIARKLSPGNTKNNGDKIEQLVGQEEQLRKRILAAGIEALNERGSVGARAVEVMYECLVGWDEDTMAIEGLELQSAHGIGVVSILRLEFLLPRISEIIGQSALPQDTLSQVLAIVHYLAQHSNLIAESIVNTPNLLRHIIHTFLLTTIPPQEDGPLPDPSALQLLVTLASASRNNAVFLVEPADALLRFVAMLPTSSPFPPSLSIPLLTLTLRFYSTLAGYGLYAQTATTAAEHLAHLTSYVLSEKCRSKRLMTAWLGLIEAWTICAIDPHQTTPSHDILWSQIVGWEWGREVLSLRTKLSAASQDWEVWSRLWQAESAWLEGARINGVKAGEAEIKTTLENVKSGFEAGVEKDVVLGAMASMRSELDALSSISQISQVPSDIREFSDHLRNLSLSATTVQAAIRLWLACIPSSQDALLITPPFQLPFGEISEFCARIVSHSFWSTVHAAQTPTFVIPFCRPLTSLLLQFLRLSKKIPGTTSDLWIAQSLSILCRLLPGDAESAMQIVDSILGLLTVDFVTAEGLRVPSIVWEKGGMNVIKPFLIHMVAPNKEAYTGPLFPSLQSIKLATTQRLSSLSSMSEVEHKQGLPLHRNWAFTPIEHLLRSGTSAVFKFLPPSWDASETEIVRSTLLLGRIIHEILTRYHLHDLMPSRSDTILACMKVFMLEHGQPQNDSVEEVFRDSTVGDFMEDLLAPYTPFTTMQSGSQPTSDDDNLEQAALPFLGPSTPFYQFYTDFVALYDGISFSHSLFNRLLLPPTSMRYPIDYRKHLWGDFSHILKTIRVPIDRVITTDIQEYFWPIESSREMLNAYLRALIKIPLEGFLRFQAIHHIACNIWPDLHGGEAGMIDTDGKLLKAFVDQASGALVREVLCYRQIRGGSSQFVYPPHCYSQAGQWKTERLEHIGRVFGSDVQERLRYILLDNSDTI